jgi:hypothetical protein
MKKMMSVMMTLLVTVLAFRAQAADEKELSVKCKWSEGVLANQFEGTVLVTGVDVVKAKMELNLSKPGSSDSSASATLNGTSRFFAAGRIGINEVTSVQLVDKGASVSRASINVNMPGLLNSSVIVNGIKYKSTCKSE